MDPSDQVDLTPDERAVIAEEEALFERARASLERAIAEAAAKRAGSEIRSVEALRELRDEAATASADDLPPLLLEMSIRQRLIERSASEPLPDPALPYVAHLRVREGEKSKDYLLGRVSFLDTPAGRPHRRLARCPRRTDFLPVPRGRLLRGRVPGPDRRRGGRSATGGGHRPSSHRANPRRRARPSSCEERSLVVSVAATLCRFARRRNGNRGAAWRTGHRNRHRGAGVARGDRAARSRAVRCHPRACRPTAPRAWAARGVEKRRSRCTAWRSSPREIRRNSRSRACGWWCPTKGSRGSLAGS